MIAPWLHPLDFIGAMHQGAALGLNRAQLETSASEAATKLGLGYADLANTAAIAGQRVSADREQAAAAMALRAQAEQGQIEHQKQSLQQQSEQAAAALQEKSLENAALNNWRSSTLGETQAHHGALEKTAASRLRELVTHHTAMEDTAAERLKRGAKIITHPETPGLLFLLEPDGSERLLPGNKKTDLTGYTKVLNSQFDNQIKGFNKKLLEKDLKPEERDAIILNREKAISAQSRLFDPPPTHVPVNIQGAQGLDVSAASALTAPSIPINSPYKEGARYGNLRYMGGDPNDETNWAPIGE